jgi:hypothetical protein
MRRRPADPLDPPDPGSTEGTQTAEGAPKDPLASYARTSDQWRLAELDPLEFDLAEIAGRRDRDARARIELLGN